MNKNYKFKKLDEEDILEILSEHFIEGELKGYINAHCRLFGKPGEDLRFVGAFSDDEDEYLQCDLEKVDEEMDFNGDHSFIKRNPEFQINPMFVENDCQEGD